MRNEATEVGSRKSDWIRFEILFLFVVFFDQATKYFYPFEIKKNSGLPFGVNLPGSLDHYVVAALLAIFIFLYWRYVRPVSFGFMFVVSGAFSNLLDRMHFGYVRDFIDVGIASVNFADIFIWGGILLLLLKKNF